MTTETLRTQIIGEYIGRIRAVLEGQGTTRQSLEEAAAILRQLAARAELFPLDTFPSPATREVGDSAHYLLHKEADDSYALYLNSINPGKITPPHNHSTWAVIVAVDGQEINKIYRAVDPVREPGPVRVELERQVVVEPGGGHVAFLGDDIHSIEVVGDRPTRHIHLYGRALERLTDRLSFDPATGAVRRYETHRDKNEKDARGA